MSSDSVSIFDSKPLLGIVPLTLFACTKEVDMEISLSVPAVSELVKVALPISED
ncbi:MAG: hypothetical protein AB9891_13175 [Anaerolineaceae bacterium]